VKASVFVGTSLDGFLARPDGAFDFLSAGDTEGSPHGFEEFLASIDAIVMGRNTYDVVLPMSVWPYGSKPVFVLSHRPLPPPPSGVVVERVSGEPSEVLSRLASRGIGHVYVDGGATIQAFIRAGLIQHLTITRVPVLIGPGSRSLATSRRTSACATSPPARCRAERFKASMQSSRESFRSDSPTSRHLTNA
jgi:dihydrofolate reductase